MAPPWIGVAGAGRDATEEDLRTAEAAGAELAAAGAVLVCGGLGGVMEAACRGARELGGTTVGLLPGAARADANPWVEVAIPTGLGEGRNVLLVRSSDALVAIGGGWGTLSEIALALRAGVPVVGVRTWEPGLGGAPAAGIETVEDGAAAVRRALALAVADRSPPA